MNKRKRRQRRVAPPHREELEKDLELAQRAKAYAKALKAKIQRIKKMEKKIRDYREERWPEKPLSHILVKIYDKFGAEGELIAIAMIKRNQWDRLLPEEKVSIEDAKRAILKTRPHLKEELETEDCPCQP